MLRGLWSCTQHDAQHTGRSEHTVFVGTPAVVWEADVGGSVFGSPVIGLNNTIAVACGNTHSLRAFSGQGQPRWTHETRFAVISAPAVQTDGSFFVADLGGYIYRLDSTGHLLWEYRNETEEPADRRFMAPLTPGPDGGVYAADWLHTLSWVRGGSAVFPPVSEAFGTAIGDNLSAAITVSSDGERLYCPLRATNPATTLVLCLDARDGADVWVFGHRPPLLGPGYPTLQLSHIALDEARNRLFVLAAYHDWNGAFLYCLDALSGTAIWTAPLALGTGSYATPALSPAGAQV